MANSVIVLSVLITGCALLTEAYNVLLLPVPAISHVIPIAAIAKGLAKRGHNTTILLGRNFPLEIGQQSHVTVERYEDYDFNYQAFYTEVHNGSLEREQDAKETKQRSKFFLDNTCQYVTLKNGPLLEKFEKIGFDMAVVDALFLMKCLLLIPHRLKIPFVTYTDYPEPSLTGLPWLPSDVPYVTTGLTDKMTFFERLKNAEFYFALASYMPTEDVPAEAINYYQQYGSFRSVSELATKSLLWLYPRDPVLDYPTPSLPNFFSVGGLTASYSTMAMSDDLKSFVESARRGSILVTFGTFVPPFPLPLATKFLDVFRQLKDVNVVWRWNVSDEIRSQVTIPSNVRVMSWIPQSDLLASPNVKLFITHCGNSGQYEALYHAVPMIGFPLFLDQKYNAGRMTSKGFGIAMNLYTFTSNELRENVERVLDDKSYAERIGKASRIFRSSPMSPVERASYWIEHVCRFGGEHLRSGNRQIPMYALWMLDVLAFVLATGVLITCATIGLIRTVRGPSNRERSRESKKTI